MTVPTEIASSRYVSLTTYRKDGTPVATPVWAAHDAGELFIVSNADAWKVKRIRNNGRVTVTKCSIRGKIAPGAASADGVARILDDAGTEAARSIIARKYVLSRIGNGLSRLLHLRKAAVVGIAVTF